MNSPWLSGVLRRASHAVPAGIVLIGLACAPARVFADDANEPNNTPAQAKALRPGQPVYASIHPTNDVDWFSFEIPPPGTGHLDLYLRNVPLKLSPRLTLFEGTNEVEVVQNSIGQPLFQRLEVKTPGRYQLRLDAGSRGYYQRGDRASPELMELLVSLLPADMSHEPNDREEAAAVIPFAKDLSAALFPSNERDCYQVTVPGNGGGLLRVSVTNCPLARASIGLRNARDGWLGSGEAVLRGDPVFLEKIAPTGGVFVVEIRDQDGGSSAPLPYAFRVDYQEPPAATGPVTPFSRAVELQPGVALRHALTAAGQADLYRVVIPEPGRGILHVRVDDVPDTIAPEVSFYREDGRVSDTTVRKRGVSLHAQRELTKPGPVFFHIQDGYLRDGEVSSSAQDDYSAQPYSVRVDFIPAMDAGEPNNNHDTARVIQPGETAEGTIFPRGDQDFFRIALPAGKQGVLEVRLEGMPDNLFPHLRVDDVSRRRLDDLEKTADRGQSAVWTRNIASGGDFFLIVRDGALDGRGRESWDDSASLQPYRLTARFTEAAGDPQEPNDTIEAAKPVLFGKPVSGLVFPGGDNDWFSLAVDEKQLGALRIEAGPFHDAMRPMIELYDPAKQAIRRWQTRYSATMLCETSLDKAGTYFLRIVCQHTRAGADISPPEQYDTRPYTLSVSRVAPFTGAVADKPDDALLLSSTLLTAGATTRGIITNRWDRDAYQLRVDAASEVTAQILEVPGEQDLYGHGYFLPDGGPALTAYKALHIHGPRGDFSLADRYPEIHFDRFEEGSAEAKNTLANPEALARYKAVIIEVLHRPEALELANPRVQENLDKFMQGGGRVLVLTPFCDLPFFNLKVEQINGWHKDQVVLPPAPHPLLPAPATFQVRGWGVQENIGFLTGWKVSGYQQLLGHASDPAGAAVSVARPTGKGWLVVDTQSTGHPAAYPQSDWKVRALLGLPAVQSLGGFNNSAPFDGSPREGQPESFRFRVPGPGRFYLVIHERDGRAPAKPAPYAVRLLTSPAPAAPRSDRLWKAEELASPSPGKPVETAVPASGAAWFRWTGVANSTLSLALEQVPADADPVLRVYRSPSDKPERPRRILYLHGNNGDARMDSSYPEFDMERIEWNDARADAILGSPLLSSYEAVVVDAMTRPNDFGLDRADLQKAVERYVAGGGVFLLSGAQCPVSLLGARSEAVQWRDEGLQETWITHPLLRLRQRMDTFTGLAGYESLGHWVLPAEADWRVALRGWFAARSQPVLAFRAIGKGHLILSTQPLGISRNLEDARWQLYSFLGVTNRLEKVAEVDRSAGLSTGGAEFLELLQQPGMYYLGVQNRYDNQPRSDMVLKRSLRVADRPLEPDDTPALAKRIPPGVESPANLQPREDEDWRRIQVDEPGVLQMQAGNVPDNLDPVLVIERVKPPATPLRVLYLEGNPANEIDESRYGGVAFTRVDAMSPGATNILARLDEFQMLVIASLSDASQFGLNRKAAHEKILAFAERGGRVLVCAPQGVSFAENSPAMGGVLESWSSEWDAGGWRALNLTDGYARPGQHGRGWCCGRGARFPHALTWSFGGATRGIDRMVVHNNTNTHGARARSLEVLAGADTNSLRRVAVFTAADTDERQEFSFPAVNCRVVRLLVHTNYGHAVETQMGEVQFFGPESIRGFFGIRNDGVASGEDLAAANPLHWIVRGRAVGDANGWPDYGRDGRWLDPEGAGFLGILSERNEVSPRAVTALRSVGSGWIAVDAQRLTSPANQDAAAWKWQNYLDVESGRIGEFDGTQERAEGGAETVLLQTRGGEDFLVRVADQPARDNLRNQSPAPYVFSSVFRTAGLANEPNDTWESATPLSAGGTVRDNFFPENDHDWFRFPVEQAADVDVRLGDVPSSVDAEVEIYRHETGVAPQRVLYLTCRTDTDLDRRDYGPLPLRFTRIDAGTPGEASAWDLLGQSSVAILEGLDNRHRFGMDLPETYQKIQRFVEQGGTFILLAPGAYSYSVIGKGSGAKVTGSSESMNASYRGPQNLVDGYWEEGNSRGGWSSRDGSAFPHWAVFETAGRTPPTLNRVVVHNTAQRPEQAVREVEIQIADRNEEGAFKSVGRFSCTNSTVRQEFSFPPAAPRFIKVLVLSNHGDKEETQCGEIEFFGPGQIEAPFGVAHFRGLESGSGVAVSDPGHWIAARREQDRNPFWYAQWSGHFTGWREQGFQRVFASSANTNDFAVTLARQTGRGWLVLDSQDLGNRENAQRNEWKLLNYFRMPSTRVGRYNQTTRDNAQGGAEIFRFAASPGQYYAHVTGRPSGVSSVQHYRLSITARPVERAFEPNDTPAQATPLLPGVVHRVTFFPERDSDWFKVDLPAGTPLVFETLRIPARMSLGVLIHAAANTQETVQNFGYRGPGVPVMGRFDPKAGGVYYLRLVDENGDRQPCLEPLEFVVRYAGKVTPTPLRVLATAPLPESTGISGNASFRVMLSAPLAADAVRAGALTAKGSLSGEVAGRVSGDPAAGTLVFTPEKPFRPGETVTFTLAAGLRDVTGNALAGATSWPVVIRADAARQMECVFRIELQPASPVPTGPVRVAILPSIPLRGPPELTAVTDSGQILGLSAPEKDAAGNWSCTMTVPAGIPRQSVLFACTALDQQGRRARKIAQGARCEVDGQPPPALNGVTARAGRNGKAVLSWPRPLGVDDLGGYEVYRAETAGADREASTMVRRLTGADVLTCEDPTPRDGTWHYRIALVDQAGNRGPLSTPVAVVTDRVPPKAVVASVTAKVVRKPAIELQWTAATGDAFAGYSLFRVMEGEPPPSPATAVPWAEPARDVLSAQIVPGDGAYRFYVATHDSAGNIGPLSPAAPVVLDTRRAQARITLDKPSPLGAGTFQAAIQLNEPLAGPLVAKVRMPGGELRPLNVRALSATHQTAALTIAETDADGWGSFVLEGGDRYGNEGIHIESGESFTLDTRPPMASIYPKAGAWLAAGTNTVLVDFSEDVRDHPVLRVGMAGRTNEVVLARVEGRRYLGRVVLDKTAPNGPVEFSVEATDAFGHRGGQVVRGARAEVDTAAPDAPLSPQSAPAPDKTLVVSWLASTREPVAFYRLYAFSNATTRVLLQDQVRDLRAVVKPDKPGALMLAVAAVDRAGNESPLSETLRAEYDLTPPPPPSSAVAAVLRDGRVRVEWKAPVVTEPLSYAVWRSTTPLAVSTNRLKVAATKDLYVLDEPKTSAVFHYGVTALDAAGNESPFAAAPPLDVDTRPPVATLALSPVAGMRHFSESYYVHYDIPVLTAGKISVVLDTTEPLAQKPRLRYRSRAHDVPADIPLTGQGMRWTGSLVLGERVDDGLLTFLFEGVDAKGNRGVDIERGKGNVAWVDSAPPGPVTGLAVTPRPVGKMECSWQPPAGEGAEILTYAVYRSARPFTSVAGLTPVAGPLRETRFTDSPPADGDYHYAVVATDPAGLTGRVAGTVAARSDGRPPAAPTGVKASIPGEILLVWQAAETEPLTWRVLRDGKPLVDGLPDKFHRDIPEKDGVYSYTVIAIDAAGNSSLASEPVKVEFNSTLPAADITINPPSPAKSSFRVLVKPSCPLKEAPDLFIRFAHGEPRRVPLESAEGKKNEWVGSVVVDSGTPNGPAEFLFQALSAEGKRGTRVRAGARMVVDTRAPSARITLDPPAPRPSGPVRVTLHPDEPLGETPDLRLTLPGAPPRELALVATGGVYVARFEITDADTDGIATFSFSGIDAAGNEGAALAGATFEVDHHVPKPPAGLKAAAVKDGQVELTWQPPVYAANEVADQLAGFRVYAAPAPITTIKGLTPLERLVSRIPLQTRVPADGTTFFAVTTVDAAGLESAPSENASAVIDRVPPAPPALAPAVVKEGVVTVTWDAVDDAATYAVEMQAPSDPDYRPVAEGQTAGRHVFRPLEGGRYAVRVTALDALGHRSLPGIPAVVYFEQTAPLAAIRLASAQAGVGRHKVTVETTRPLVAAPKLAFTDSAGKTRSLTVTGEGRSWTAELLVDASLAAGEGHFTYEGTTRDQGAPVTGTGILTGEALTLDFTPPTAAIVWSGPVPVVGGKSVLNAGRHAFLLRASEPLQSGPVLKFTPRGAAEERPELIQTSPAEWTGVILVTTNTPSGAAVFELEAVDRQGNKGDVVTENRVVDIDVDPPARIAQIRAAPLPGGHCRVEWTAPCGKAGRPDAQASTFNLYRAESEIVDATGLEVYRRLQRVLGYVDTPTADRTYHYAVAAVDAAGNVGPVSASASAVIDKTAPGVPMDVRATVMSNGVVHLAWTPPPGEKPLFYNVYLEQNPILATAGLSPMNRGVTWTEIYGTPNHDGKYFFAVTAVDAALNESAASENAGIDYKAIPPIARFFLEPDIWVTDGEHPLRLEITKKLVEAPSVEINAESGRRIPLGFSGAGDRWAATLKIDDSFPEGTYGFIFRGKDEAGNLGDEIARGPLFHVDRTAPLPPSGLVVEPDTRGTPGAVKLSWHTPKRAGQTTEVPMRYHVYRGSQPITSVQGLRPVQVVGVKFANLDDYDCLDVPPANGTFHYAVTSLDLAGNESGPGNSTPVTVQSDAPRGSFSLYRVRGTEIVPAATDAQGLPVIGRGKARVRLAAAVPLKAAPAVTWRIKQEGRKALPVVMQGGGAEWWGEFEVAENLESGEEAVFAFSATAATGVSGSYISKGETFLVDTTGPAVDVIVASTFKMKVNVKARALQTPPVGAGLQAIRLVAPEELAAPPALSLVLGEARPVAIPLTGYGRHWSGFMEIPDAAHGVEGRFAFSGVDLAGNPSTRIAKVRYEHEDDGEFPTPRRTASYATTGGRFSTDTRPPEMPDGLQLEMRKLGVAVIQWREPAGEPNSYNLYRSLTPITDAAGLTPVRRDIYATIIVDDPPVDGNYYYAVTAVDFAGNESAIRESKSVFIDTIKPELKIKAAPLGDDFVILLDEDAPEELSLTLRFPGQRDIQVDLGGSSGELAEYKVVCGPNGERRVVLPQQVGFFNGKVEVIVHSPDPEGNMVEEKTELEMKQIAAATGGTVSSSDEQVQLIIPPGLAPFITEGPGKSKRVGGYENIFFIKYANIPKEKPVVAEGEKRRREEVDPLPPGVEIIGVPYVIEMNQPPEEPLELKDSASQGDHSKLKPLMAKLRMKVPRQYSNAVQDPGYLKSRLSVRQWVPVSANQKAGRWEPVPDVEIDPKTNEFIVPVNRITTYVIIAERTPPAVREMQPGRDETITDFQPVISCLLVDKGTGLAVGAENRIVLTLDGRKIPEKQVEIAKGDPTEVRVTFRPSEQLTPGRHTVGIRAEDVVENVADVKWQFLIDNKPPVILGTLPDAGERLPVARPMIQVGASDEGGIQEAACRIAVDGEDLPAASTGFDPGAGLLTGFLPWDLRSGVHEARVEVVDAGGLSTVKTWKFAVDLEAPALAARVPETGIRIDPADARIAFALRDGLGQSQVLDFRIDGRKILPARWRLAPGFSYDPVKGVGAFAAGTLPSGEHEVSLVVSDDLGNTALQGWRFKSDVPAEMGVRERDFAPPPLVVTNRVSRGGVRGIPPETGNKPAKPVIPGGGVSAPLAESDLKVAQRMRRLLAEAGYEEGRGNLEKAKMLYGECLSVRSNQVVAARLAALELRMKPAIPEPPVQNPPGEMELLKARRARAEAGYLETKGDLSGAIAAYELSLKFAPDPQIRLRVDALRKKLGSPLPPPVPPPAEVPAPAPISPEVMAAVRRARAEAAYYESKGEYQKALASYEKAQKLHFDPALAPVMEKLRAKIGP